MNLTKKQKSIIWATVLVIVLFLGLIAKHEEYPSSLTAYQLNAFKVVRFYGMRISMSPRAWADRWLYAVAKDYKFPFIIATMLIGLTGVLTAKKK